MPVSTVIFDLGGVLVDWNPDYLYRQLIPDATERSWFLTEVCNGAWNAQQDRGRDWEIAIAEKTVQFPQHAALIRAYRERWIETIGGRIEETVVVLDELKAHGVPLYALTNWAADTFREARHIVPLDRFTGVVVSGEVKMMKPEPEIFQLLLQQFGLHAPDCLFIDDMPYNTAAAATLGFETITFTGAAALRQELTRYQLL